MDGLVQQLVETILDAGAIDDRPNLADSLPRHRADVWLRLRASDQTKAAMVRRRAICRQSCGEPDIHANPIRIAELTVGCRGYLDRLGNDYLDSGRHLETLQIGCFGAASVLRLGLDCHGHPAEHHLDESMIQKNPRQEFFHRSLAC